MRAHLAIQPGRVLEQLFLTIHGVDFVGFRMPVDGLHRQTEIRCGRRQRRTVSLLRSATDTKRYHRRHQQHGQRYAQRRRYVRPAPQPTHHAFKQAGAAGQDSSPADTAANRRPSRQPSHNDRAALWPATSGRSFPGRIGTAACRLTRFGLVVGYLPEQSSPFCRIVYRSKREHLVERRSQSVHVAAVVDLGRLARCLLGDMYRSVPSRSPVAVSAGLPRPWRGQSR